MSNLPRSATAVCLSLIALVASVLTAAPARAASYRTTIVNLDSAGRQVTKFDTEGNAVDAHDGELALFGDTYYLYGTSYDCGYRLQVSGTPFCGFKTYSSPDLVHWTDRGPLFDASTVQWQSRCAPPRFGCYRPHVVYNAQTQRYVLWINGYDNASGYHVFTAADPVGPFVEEPEPTLAHQGTGPGFNNGDMDLFVDDGGGGYLAYTDIRRRHTPVVERLTATYTSGTGEAADAGVPRTPGCPAWRALRCSAAITSFQSGSPNRDLVLDVVRLDTRLQPVGAPLSTATVPRDRVGWSPRVFTVQPGVSLLAGNRYGVLARTSSTTGCYGFSYNDTGPYAFGSAAYRKGSTAWTAETFRSLKFHTSVTPQLP